MTRRKSEDRQDTATSQQQPPADVGSFTQPPRPSTAGRHSLLCMHHHPTPVLLLLPPSNTPGPPPPSCTTCAAADDGTWVRMGGSLQAGHGSKELGAKIGHAYLTHHPHPYCNPPFDQLRRHVASPATWQPPTRTAGTSLQGVRLASLAPTTPCPPIILLPDPAPAGRSHTTGVCSCPWSFDQCVLRPGHSW